MSGFDIVPGDPGSHVVLHVPHASRFIPPDVRAGILFDDAALSSELDAMTDAFTDVIAERAAESAVVRPWIFVNRQSRLVVDPERVPDDREEMSAVGMGAVYTRASDGRLLRTHDDALIDEHFVPYAEMFTSMVEHFLDVSGEVTILDVHSYPLAALPYELHGDGPRPEICLGTDWFHTPDWLDDGALEAFSDFEVSLDSPFAGCYVPLQHLYARSEVQSLMIEIRRDLYMDDAFQLVDLALAPIVDGLTRLIDLASHPRIYITCGGMLPEPGDLA